MSQQPGARLGGVHLPALRFDDVDRSGKRGSASAGRPCSRATLPSPRRSAAASSEFGASCSRSLSARAWVALRGGQVAASSRDQPGIRERLGNLRGVGRHALTDGQGEALVFLRCDVVAAGQRDDAQIAQAGGHVQRVGRQSLANRESTAMVIVRIRQMSRRCATSPRLFRLVATSSESGADAPGSRARDGDAHARLSSRLGGQPDCQDCSS